MFTNLLVQEPLCVRTATGVLILQLENSEASGLQNTKFVLTRETGRMLHFLIMKLNSIEELAGSSFL
jgi:hypothetical protein